MSDDLTLSLPEQRLIRLLRRERVQPFLIDLAVRSMPEALQQIGELHGYLLSAEGERATAAACDLEANTRAWAERIDEIALVSGRMAEILERIAAHPDPSREAGVMRGGKLASATSETVRLARWGRHDVL